MLGLPGLSFFFIFILWPLLHVIAIVLALKEDLWEEAATDERS